MKHVMIFIVRLYKKVLSPILPNSCRFTPTCSSYAIEAFEKRGFFAGLILTVWRILRCNPFCKGGYDPVPEKGFRRIKTNEHTHTDTGNVAQNSIEAEIATLPIPSETLSPDSNLTENAKEEEISSDGAIKRTEIGKDNSEA